MAAWPQQGSWASSGYYLSNHATFFTIAVLVLPVLVALARTRANGRRAKSWGRRPLLLIGFGVLPIRTLLFTVISDPWNGVEPAP